MCRRLVLAIVAGLAAGCAQAGSNQAVVDAPAGNHDAHATSDAPSMPIDAPADTCTSTATCVAAKNLGSVSGDTGNASVMASGYQAAWYVVRVTEDDNDPFAVPMLLFTQLTSPANAMYDVFVYVDETTDDIDCTTPVGTPTTTGTAESLDLEWGETGVFANGVDDSRSVSIEIRPKSGDSCSTTAPWQLVVTGDT